MIKFVLEPISLRNLTLKWIKWDFLSDFPTVWKGKNEKIIRVQKILRYRVLLVCEGSVSSEVTLKFPLFSPLLLFFKAETLHQKVVFELGEELLFVHFYLSSKEKMSSKAEFSSAFWVLERLRKCHEKVFCMISNPFWLYTIKRASNHDNLIHDQS